MPITTFLKTLFFFKYHGCSCVFFLLLFVFLLYFMLETPFLVCSSSCLLIFTKIKVPQPAHALAQPWPFASAILACFFFYFLFFSCFLCALISLLKLSFDEWVGSICRRIGVWKGIQKCTVHGAPIHGLSHD